MTYQTYGQPLPGKQPSEDAEMATFFNGLPQKYKAVALHIRNEGRRTNRQMTWEKARGGFIKGASDILIPGAPAFVCELKSLSKTARVSKEQIAYLENSAALGAFSCLCYGYEAAMEAFNEWRQLIERTG